MLSIGENVPNFALPNKSGEIKTPKDFAGGALVMYFYPRDNTPGCTKESIGFTEMKPEFEKLGATIIGVSKDSVKSHQKFVEKQNLGVELLSDEDGTLCEDMGVWKEKSMYGKTYFGIERSTFIFDANGKLTHEWCKVKVPGHVEAVLEALKNG